MDPVDVPGGPCARFQPYDITPVKLYIEVNTVAMSVDVCGCLRRS